MKFTEKSKLVLSSDTNNEPKQIRFSEEFEDIDVTNLKESVTRQETFPVGTHSISMGNIALGRFLLIKPKNNLTASIGGENLNLKGGKISRLWADFASLDIVVSTEPQEVLIVVAGE